MSPGLEASIGVAVRIGEGVDVAGNGVLVETVRVGVLVRLIVGMIVLVGIMLGAGSGVVEVQAVIKVK
jgi:hypothetical protein